MNRLHKNNITELEELLDYMHTSRQKLLVRNNHGVWNLYAVDVYSDEGVIIATLIDVEVEDESQTRA